MTVAPGTSVPWAVTVTVIGAAPRATLPDGDLHRDHGVRVDVHFRIRKQRGRRQVPAVGAVGERGGMRIDRARSVARPSERVESCQTVEYHSFWNATEGVT